MTTTNLEKNQTMMLSVCMITYNHEKYIIQAIENVLNQVTNFDFELIISNDNSTDKTNELIIEYLKTNPDKKNVIYINNEKNLGMMPNFTYTLKKCSGKYIALCEGDDYWTNKNKLQKQVGFLEQNSSYSICFHKVDVEIEGKIQNDEITFSVPITTGIKDLAKGNYIHTCSAVYRNNLFEFPDYFIKAPVGDYFLHMLNARFGKIYHIEEKMAIYRVHNTSYWSSKEQIDREKIWIDFIKNIQPNFDKNIKKILSKQIYKLKKARLRGLKKTLYKIQYFLNNY
ncbi:MAG TPA: glycosyltransferase [Flavobacterium sp.]